MCSRAPAVTFKRQSLEKWMEIFADYDWQKSFSKQEIREGVRFYEDCVIREIEIRSDDIIVRYQGEGKSQYFAVLDFNDHTLSARSSIADDTRPAIGALLAMDEVLIDKQETLFTSDPEAENTSSAETSETAITSNPTENYLRLSFYLSGQNLCFRVYWIETNKLVFPENLSSKGIVLTKEKRDQIVKLIHLARKSNFVFYKQSKEYRMTSLCSAVDFCRYELPKWETAFQIQLDTQVQKLREGIQEIHATFAAQENPDTKGLHLALNLSTANGILTPNFTSKLLKNNGNPLFIEGVGAVRLSGKAVHVIRDQQAILGKFTEIPRYMMYSIFGQSEVPYEENHVLTQWKESFASAPIKPFILPKILRSYQREGVLWMNHLLTHGFHGLLADDMGLGKTLQVLTFISKLDPDAQTIVVCPASVLHVWQKEAEKFFPRLTVNIFSAESDLDTPGVNVWVVSYTQLRRQKNVFAKKCFQLAVLDEAQFIKNSTTKVFHACNALKAEWRLALSGTPIENNLLDLWSIFRFLMPGLLGEKSQFIELCKTDDIAEKIKKQIAPFMLRRTKETVAKELPQKLEVNLSCELTPEQQRLYKEVVSHTFRRYRDKNHQLDLKNHRFGILSALTRLRQVSCDPGLLSTNFVPYDQSGKLVLLRSLLQREFSISGRKVVIFSQFVRFLQRIKGLIQEDFPTIELSEIIGSTKNRDTIVEKFQNTENNAAILVSLRAGGIGITLTAAETVFLMDPWWNPSVERQAMDRVHRIGQNKNVTVYRFITQNSIESGIQRLQERKNNLFEEIIDSLRSKQGNTEFFLEHVDELLKCG